MTTRTQSILWRAGAYLLIATLLVLCVSVSHAQTTRSATVTFVAPTAYTNGEAIPTGTTITYTLYQGLKGAAKVSVGTVTGNTRTINTGLQAGQEYCWHVTATIAGQTSAPSNDGCKAFEPNVPAAVTITVT